MPNWFDKSRIQWEEDFKQKDIIDQKNGAQLKCHTFYEKITQNRSDLKCKAIKLSEWKYEKIFRI